LQAVPSMLLRGEMPFGIVRGTTRVGFSARVGSVGIGKMDGNVSQTA